MRLTPSALSVGFLKGVFPLENIESFVVTPQPKKFLAVGQNIGCARWMPNDGGGGPSMMAPSHYSSSSTSVQLVVFSSHTESHSSTDER